MSHACSEEHAAKRALAVRSQQHASSDEQQACSAIWWLSRLCSQCGPTGTGSARHCYGVAGLQAHVLQVRYAAGNTKTEGVACMCEEYPLSGSWAAWALCGACRQSTPPVPHAMRSSALCARYKVWSQMGTLAAMHTTDAVAEPAALQGAMTTLTSTFESDSCRLLTHAQRSLRFRTASLTGAQPVIWVRRRASRSAFTLSGTEARPFVRI